MISVKIKRLTKHCKGEIMSELSSIIVGGLTTKDVSFSSFVYLCCLYTRVASEKSDSKVAVRNCFFTLVKFKSA